MSDTPTNMRPSDLALFLLASGENLPRQRARDQQADIAGLELKRHVLNLLIAADPEPNELDAVLMRIVTQLGQPTAYALRIQSLAPPAAIVICEPDDDPCCTTIVLPG